MQDCVLSNAEFSSVVGVIYDCALDPGLWPNAIREVCEATRSFAGVIGVSDLSTGAAHLRQHWNFDEDWLDRMVLHGPEVAAMLASVPDLHTRELDEPVVAMRDFDPAVALSSRYYNEWLRPQGIIDAINLTVLRQKDRIGSLALSRHESAGAISDRDVAIVRLLAPHIRRAIAVSNVLGMQAMKVRTFEASLDLIGIGVVLVDARSVIVHANRAAQSMLAAGSPIRSDRGELRTCLPETSAALRAAIAKAADNEAAIGGAGIGMPAPQASGDPAFIYVLPLMSGDVRPRIAPRASAALFITATGNGAELPAEAIAAMFDLSPAEVRVLERLIAGRTPAEVADDLGSALPTVRTHLSNIFAKTGTTGQADLIRLAASLAAPIRRT
jgi:DNA-binding CsgD family transcriptional regulator/PAS domain-containing protein